MKTQFTITETVDKIAISSPFSHSNNLIFKAKGGQWDPESKKWIFDRTAVTADMIIAMFGAISQLVIARVPMSRIAEHDRQWKTGGYVIAIRFRHNSAVEIPDGVQLAIGLWYPTGGTPAAPRVTGSADLSITMVMRRSYAEREGFDIVATDDDAVSNPLSDYSVRDLLDELRRRGIYPGDDDQKDLAA